MTGAWQLYDSDRCMSGAYTGAEVKVMISRAFVLTHDFKHSSIKKCDVFIILSFS